ncbi:hypothetical protein CF326_g6483 [Tilletia indica]|nr:hypothetical protein CF326_g6483 [Tilletia indica]
MVHFCKLIALLPFLASTFALPLEHAPPGLSLAGLHPDRAHSQSESPDFSLILPAKRVRLLPRNDPVTREGWQWFNEAVKIMQDPKADLATFDESIRKGKQAIHKLGASIEEDEKAEKAAKARRPPYRFFWPKYRLNTNPSTEKPSTSGRPWPGKW